ncbi:MAG: hypothetical protein LC650_05915 [Actinobacteria bacterium]|nr:hypothetical protein [Actinomycetota bacterium]
MTSYETNKSDLNEMMDNIAELEAQLQKAKSEARALELFMTKDIEVVKDLKSKLVLKRGDGTDITISKKTASNYDRYVYVNDDVYRTRESARRCKEIVAAGLEKEAFGPAW